MRYILVSKAGETCACDDEKEPAAHGRLAIFYRRHDGSVRVFTYCYLSDGEWGAKSKGWPVYYEADTFETPAVPV